MTRTLSTLAILLMITAAPSLPAAAQDKLVEVSGAWARATIGKADSSAAYLTLQSAAGDKLTGASTPAAKKAELNNMSMEGSVMKMRRLPAIELPAGQKVTLQPNGLHIMLTGLAEPLAAGQSFPLTLHFEKAGDQQISVTVEKAGASGPESAAGGTMPMPMPTSR